MDLFQHHKTTHNILNNPQIAYPVSGRESNIHVSGNSFLIFGGGGGGEYEAPIAPAANIPTPPLVSIGPKAPIGIDRGTPNPRL